MFLSFLLTLGFPWFCGASSPSLQISGRNPAAGSYSLMLVPFIADIEARILPNDFFGSPLLFLSMTLAPVASPRPLLGRDPDPRHQTGTNHHLSIYLISFPLRFPVTLLSCYYGYLATIFVCQAPAFYCRPAFVRVALALYSDAPPALPLLFHHAVECAPPPLPRNRSEDNLLTATPPRP